MRNSRTNRELFSPTEAHRLSGCLYPLGDQGAELWDKLKRAGYGEPILEQRRSLLSLAGSAESYTRLERYWAEYAKERLAGLAGPINIFKGQLPKYTAYRSSFLDSLRIEASNCSLQDNGAIRSPQIEPTLKRYVELRPNDPVLVDELKRVRQARKRGAAMLALNEIEDFSIRSAETKYEELKARYYSHLETVGFAMGTTRKKGAIFHRSVPRTPWSIIFSEESREGLLSGYNSLESTIALAPNGVKVVPGAVEFRSAVAFPPDLLIYGFRAACGFEGGSYAEFCLACDTNAFFVEVVSSLVEKLVSACYVSDI